MPSITDWIEAIGVLITLPTAFWAIVKLFKKDLDTQRKISALTELAESQKTMITILQQQLTEVQKQSSIFYDQNEIFRLHHQKIQDLSEQELAEKQLKNRLEHKPYIQYRNASHSGCDIKTTLHNIGKKALNVSFTIESEHFCKVNSVKSLEVWNSEQRIEIGCYADLDGGKLKNYSFKLTITYFDEINNHYKQTFEYGNMGVSKISEPELILNT